MYNKVSFVIPCYRSERTIEFVVKELKDTAALRKDKEIEIILVNDCSPDNVYSVISRLADEDERVKGINFTKNFGKASAVLAGISEASGDIIISLDDDGQCPGNKFWDFVDALENNNADVAYADYPVRQEKGIKKLGSTIYTKLMHYLIEQPDNIKSNNMVAIRDYIAKEMIKYQNPFPAIHPLLMQISHSVVMVPAVERDRADDKGGGFSFFKSIKLLINGCTNFSIKPLRLAEVVGSLVALAGFIYALIIVFKKIMNFPIETGYASLMAAILFIGGVIMILLGIIGEYLGRLYICVNNSPQYVIKEKRNLK